jgi:oligoendopeptidase F
MEYTRPDMAAMEKDVQDLCAQAATEANLDALMEEIFAFYDLYDGFSTAYNLAMIHYYQDLSSSYWKEEHEFCMDHASDADAALDKLYRALAKSPLRDKLEGDDYFGADYFDYYEGESLYDEALLAMMDEEAQVLSRYYAVSAEAAGLDPYSDAYLSRFAPQLTDILLDLVRVRQGMAIYCGYARYSEFAYDFYYYRDYTPNQVAKLLPQIRRELVPLYRQLDSTWWNGVSYSYSQQKVMDYVRTAAQNMGGMVWEAFQVMEYYQLSDTEYGVNKHNISFEIYLPSYNLPYLFVNAGGTKYDCLTVTHEFGHFCNDYASYGSYAGIDVKEIFSQGMEYLSLCYTSPDQGMATAKMADSLCIYVEQAAYADFEMRIYDLPAQDISAQAIIDIYAQVMEDYGLVKGDPRYFVTIPHFYSYPMYVISYVVSNDAAMQIYQLELEEAGAGLAMMEENYDTQEAYFLAFLETAGLESPFVPGRMAQVSKTFSEILDR